MGGCFGSGSVDKYLEKQTDAYYDELDTYNDLEVEKLREKRDRQLAIVTQIEEEEEEVEYFFFEEEPESRDA